MRMEAGASQVPEYSAVEGGLNRSFAWPCTDGQRDEKQEPQEEKLLGLIETMPLTPSAYREREPICLLVWPGHGAAVAHGVFPVAAGQTHRVRLAAGAELV